ncbi:MAG: hypothetical protein SOY30_15420 [Eubacteriales bacterium]|nr:hypothetical protein [Eubacteriales bacterium]
MLNRLSYKLVVAVAAALLTVMVAGFILLNHQLIRSAEYDILQSYSREIQQIGDNLDTYTAGLEDTLLSLLCDTRLQEAINRPPEEETLENQLAEIRTLREVVSYVESNRHVNRVRLYLSDEKILSREQVNFFSHTDALDTPEYQEMTGRRMSLHWMGLHRVKTTYADDEYVTLGLLYRGNFLSESRNWALILLDLLPGTFTDALDKIASAYDGAQALIADSAGNVMVGGDSPLWLDALNGHGWNGGLGFFDCDGRSTLMSARAWGPRTGRLPWRCRGRACATASRRC